MNKEIHTRTDDMRLELRLLREGLTEREQRIISMRFDCGMTLQEISDKIGVTRERIRQIEGRAMQKLRKGLLRE